METQMFWRKLICICRFYKPLFRLICRTKGVLLQCTKQSYQKTVRKKPCAFLSYKISQLLPNFTSTTIFMCFPSSQPTFLENFSYNAKPRILSCFCLIFIAIIILVQFYISFGGMQSVHILKNLMSLDNKMLKQAGCFPFLTGTIRVIWVRLTAAFKLMLFCGKDSCFSIGAQFAVANFYWQVHSLGKENGTSSHNASCWNSGLLCVAH